METLVCSKCGKPGSSLILKEEEQICWDCVNKEKKRNYNEKLNERTDYEEKLERRRAYQRKHYRDNPEVRKKAIERKRRWRKKMKELTGYAGSPSERLKKNGKKNDYYQRRKNDPEYREKLREYNRKWYREKKATDPYYFEYKNAKRRKSNEGK